MLSSIKDAIKDLDNEKISSREFLDYVSQIEEFKKEYPILFGIITDYELREAITDDEWCEVIKEILKIGVNNAKNSR